METTLSLSDSTIEKLKKLAQILEISRSQVICRIAAYISSRDDMNCNSYLAKYQDFQGNGFSRVHVYFRKNDAKLALDLRRFFGGSFSLLIATAVDRFYNELCGIISDTDNYPNIRRTQAFQREDTAVIWTQKWEKTENYQKPAS